MTKYAVSPWLEGFPRSRVPNYPPHRGSGEASVVIVGGGLTGLATAYAFAAAGIKPVLFEAAAIARGATAAGAGIISTDPGVDYAAVEKALGRRAALRAWQAWRRAALDFQALLRRLDIACGLEPRPALTIARTPEQSVRVHREQKARRDAGLDAALINGRRASAESGTAAASGIRTAEGAVFDPYRAAVGLAAAARARGAKIFERTEVTKITFTRKLATVVTATGSIRATRVVVATGVPGRLAQSLRRHFWFGHSFFALTQPIPSRVRQQLGPRAAVLRDLASPPHSIRWVNDERLLVSGADADPIQQKQQTKILVQRTGQLMYELSTLYPDISGIPPEYGWDVAYARTADGLPYFGAHRNFPFHLFAFGNASASATGAYLASRIFLRQHLDEPDAADEVFGFHR